MGRTITIGRERSTDLVLSDETVSRRHALAERLDARTIRVTDLGSINGTWRVHDGRKEKAKSFVMELDDTAIFGQRAVSGHEIGKALTKVEANSSDRRSAEWRHQEAPGMMEAQARAPIRPDSPHADPSGPRGEEPLAGDRHQNSPVPRPNARPRRHPVTNEIIRD